MAESDSVDPPRSEPARTPGRRDWRPAPSAMLADSLPRPDWKQDVEPLARRSRAGTRAIRVAGTLAVFTVSCGLLVWVSTWLRLPRPVALVLVGAGYENNLTIAPNVHGWRGLSDLAATAASSHGGSRLGERLARLAIGPRELQSDVHWAKGLDAVTEPILFVFFAVHGGTDAKGAYLLPNDADAADDADDRIRLESVLETLADLPGEKRKVLVLDCAQVESDWARGMLVNDFGRELANQDERIAAIPNLVVIASSSLSQRSWASDEWRQTAFMHFLLEGLHGAADANGDTRIDARELFSFTRDSVRDWVWANRIATQTPLLLPTGPEGMRRASAIDLSFAHREGPPADFAKLPEYVPPASLKDAWVHCQELASSFPAPAVYTPHLWRRYLDILLRYDELTRMGADQSWGQALLQQLEELEQAMSQARYLELSSIQNSLAMPALAGRPPRDAAQDDKLFARLWDALPKDYAATWAKLRQGSTDLVATRMAIFERLFQRAAEAPAANLEKVGDLARLIADPVYPLPAELATILLFHRHLPHADPNGAGGPAGAPALVGEANELVRTALELERLASTVSLGGYGAGYPYSEEVHPWIVELTREGDRDRLKAVDLLFVGGRENLEQARALFGNARAFYQAADARAALLRRALATRDRALPLLPYYCRWVASLRPGTLESDGADEALGALAQRTCQETYRLVDQLAPPAPSPAPGADSLRAEDPVLREIDERASVVAASFNSLESRYLEAWRRYADVDLPLLWREAEAALAVPYLDPALRMRLIEHSRRISRRFLVETAQAEVAGPAVGQRESLDWSIERGKNQGQMALAVLGRKWFDECQGARLENFEQVEHRLNTFSVEQEWWKSLAVAGEQLGYRFRALSGEVDKLFAAARRQQGEDGLFGLRRAVRLTRLLGGVDVLDAMPGPLTEQRRRRAATELVAQADRTARQHWTLEDSPTEPYYRQAGTLYLDDAMGLDPEPSGAGPVHEARARLSAPGQLNFDGPGELSITSEQNLSVVYRLTPAADAWIPEGYAAIWVNPGADLTLETPAPDTRERRAVGKDGAAPLVSCGLSSPLVGLYEDGKSIPGPVASQLRLEGLYRGQRITREVPTRIGAVPDLVARQTAPPPLASIAVRADESVGANLGTSQGAITFVLDCSGSMGPPPGEGFSTSTRYAQAIQALEIILGQIPKGPRVSIWVFGEAVGPDKTAVEPARTVRQALPPTPWDPANPARLQSILTQLQYPAVEPWNQSPITRAMLYAKEDLARGNGSRTMIVLSDGIDNCFADDAQLNPDKRSIATALTQAFGQSGIEILFLGFQVPGPEQERIENQFRVVTTFATPGQFLHVDEVEEVVQTVSGVLRKALRYGVTTLANAPAPGMPAGGLEVSAPGGNSQWYPGGLAPGAYNLVVQGDNWLETPFVLNQGDLLLVDLRMGGTGLFPERAVYAKQAFPWRPARQVANWYFALLQNQAIPKVPGGLGAELLLSLERLPDPRAATLEVLRPIETWMEVAADGTPAAAIAQDWSLEYGYPTPAWSLVVSNWPTAAVTGAPAAPRIKAWWNPDQPRRPAAILQRGADFKQATELRDRAVMVDGTNVTLDSVRLEQHVVQTGPNQRTRQPCLVVRLRSARRADISATGSPSSAEASEAPLARARVGGISYLAQEERFYRSEAAYALLVWPVGADEAAGITELDLLSLSDFKKNAERRGFVAELAEVGAPTPDDARPPKPVSLGPSPTPGVSPAPTAVGAR